MAIFSVTTVIKTKHGCVWFLADFPQATIDEVYDALSSKGAVLIEKLELGEPVHNRPREIVSREKQVLGVLGVVQITPPHIETISAGRR